MKKINLRKWAAVAVIICVLSMTGIGIYAADYYRADALAVAALSDSEGVVVCETEEGFTAFRPDHPTAGLIFYPGGKVEHTAYAPLLHALAQEGVLCVLTQMPMNLAVLDINAADGIQRQFSEVEHWYIAGHSLGGSMAASYLKNCGEEYEGLILLAAYSTADLSGMDLKVLSLYGSADGVLNMKKYAENRSNLPDGVQESLLDGGNHAQFGSYGLQAGDGAADLTAEEQLTQTVEQIAAFIGI